MFKINDKADLVINLAAESHVDKSFNNSIIFSKSNELGTHTLMEACKQIMLKKLFMLVLMRFMEKILISHLKKKID